MKAQPKSIRIAEYGLIFFAWLVILVTPFLFGGDNKNPVWKTLLRQLETLVPLAIVFFTNRFILVPRLLFKNKPMAFIGSVIGVIAVLTVTSYFVLVGMKLVPQVNKPPREDQRPPRQNPPAEGKVPWKNLRNEQQRQPRPIPPYGNFLILAVLLVGFDTGLKGVMRWTEVEQEKVNLEKEHVATQLVILRNQISPHFFMNTLNNIHSLVDINSDEAKVAIIKLSKMMRYLLYETETENTTLKREIEFLQSYIDLMKLRFSDKVQVTLSLPPSLPDKTLPPLLFASLIENAFKHGISYKQDSFISIDLTIGNDRLLLVVKNSKTDQEPGEQFSGIGIANTRKRLELLYGSKYHMEMIDNPDMFTVNLSIPI